MRRSSPCPGKKLASDLTWLSWEFLLLCLAASSAQGTSILLTDVRRMEASAFAQGLWQPDLPEISSDSDVVAFAGRGGVWSDLAWAYATAGDRFDSDCLGAGDVGAYALQASDIQATHFQMTSYAEAVEVSWREGNAYGESLSSLSVSFKLGDPYRYTFEAGGFGAATFVLRQEGGDDFIRLQPPFDFGSSGDGLLPAGVYFLEASVWAHTAGPSNVSELSFQLDLAPNSVPDAGRMLPLLALGIAGVFLVRRKGVSPAN